MDHSSCLLPRTRLSATRLSQFPSKAIQRTRGQTIRVQTRCQRSVLTQALKGVLCDLDGVIYASGSSTVIPGALETLKYFRERQIPLLFVTNTNTKNREGLAARLRGMGIPCRAEDILSPAKLAADWLRENSAGPVALFVAPELSTEFAGIQLLPPSAESGAAAVVIGDMGLDWNYNELNRAFRLVMDGHLRVEANETTTTSSSSSSSIGAPEPPHCKTTTTTTTTNNNNNNKNNNGCSDGPQPKSLTLISLGKGRYYKDTDGFSLDVGPFTAALEYATDSKAVVLGKPDPLIFCLSAESLGLNPEEVVMIGDDVRGDVGGAQAAGLKGILVRTGKFREHDLAVGVTPDAVLPSIAELPAWWHQHQQQQQKQLQEEEQQEAEQEQQEQPVTAGGVTQSTAVFAKVIGA